jgi:hypothetical protein
MGCGKLLHFKRLKKPKKAVVCMSTITAKTAWDILHKSDYLTEKVTCDQAGDRLEISNDKDDMHTIFVANRKRMEMLGIADRLADKTNITN